MGILLLLENLKLNTGQSESVKITFGSKEDIFQMLLEDNETPLAPDDCPDCSINEKSIENMRA